MLAVALGETDDVVVRFPIAAGGALDGAPMNARRLGEDTGFHLLAIRRGGPYLYRPRGEVCCKRVTRFSLPVRGKAGPRSPTVRIPLRRR